MAVVPNAAAVAAVAAVNRVASAAVAVVLNAAVAAVTDAEPLQANLLSIDNEGG